MHQPFSKNSQALVKFTKNIAVRFENNFIGVEHFLLGLNAFNENSKLHIRITFGDKRDIIKNLKGKRFPNIIDNDYRLSKQMEEGLKSSGFHCWIMGDREIQPEHIYLGIIATEVRNKQNYIDLLKNANIRLSKVKGLLINFYFNQFFRKSGISKFLR